MIDVRQFIRQLGDKAPDFFGTKEQTVARWLKTGNIPFKAVEKVLAASEALNALSPEVKEAQQTPAQAPLPTSPEPDVDPITHLPTNIDRRLPQIQAAPGHGAQVIEMSPTEQNWGVNLTRPGRVAPLPPMKVRKVDGQDVAYVEQPAPVTVLPPSISGDAGWSDKGNPLPQPKKDNERSVPQKPTEGVSESKV